MLQKTGISKFKILIELGRNITAIYFISWTIIGVTETIFMNMLGYTFSYAQIYLYAGLLLVISQFIAKLWNKRKHRS